MVWTRKDDMDNTVKLIRSAIERLPVHYVDTREEERVHRFEFSNLGQTYVVTVERVGGDDD